MSISAAYQPIWDPGYAQYSQRGVAAAYAPQISARTTGSFTAEPVVVPVLPYGTMPAKLPDGLGTPVIRSVPMTPTAPLLGSQRSVIGAQAVLSQQGPLIVPVASASRTMGSRQGSVASLGSAQSWQPPVVMTPSGPPLACKAKANGYSPCPSAATAAAPIATAVPFSGLKEGHPSDGKVLQLTIELEASKANEAKLQEELRAAKSEIEHLLRVLAIERANREQAEARDKVESVNKRYDSVEPSEARRAPQARSKTPSRKAREGELSAGSTPVSMLRSPEAPRPASPSRGSPGAGRGGAGSAKKKGMTEDEVDAKLNDYLATSPHCRLEFRRLNRGWYEFRRIDEERPETRCVEMTMVNGKLMVRLEPTTHDAGWNHGKLGPIDRFVMAYSS